MNRELAKLMNKFLEDNKDKDKGLEMLYTSNKIVERIKEVQEKVINSQNENNETYCVIAFEEILTALDEIEKNIK